METVVTTSPAFFSNWLSRRAREAARAGLLLMLVAALAGTAQAQDARLGTLGPGSPDAIQDAVACFCNGVYDSITMRYEGAATSGAISIRFNSLAGTPSTNFGTLDPGDVITVNPPGGETTLGTELEVFEGGVSRGTIGTDCGAGGSIGPGNIGVNGELEVGGSTFFRVAAFTDASGVSGGLCKLQSDPEIVIALNGAIGPFDVGDTVPLVVNMCNNRRNDASSQTCNGSGSDWPFGLIDADDIILNILLKDRLSYNNDASVSINGAACGTCSTSSSGQTITVTIPYGTTVPRNFGPAGSQPKVEITFTADVTSGTVENNTPIAITEVSKIFPTDADATSDDCNLADFTVSPANDDDCARVISSLLPVELVAFDALVDGRKAMLRWETASETNNAGFEIQHRYVEGTLSAFEAIGFTEGAGTTAEAKAYSFAAEDLLPGRHIFRLKQVDYDGTFEYSPQIEVAVDMPVAFLISNVYPNPFNPEASFSFGVKQTQQVTVEVFNMLGQRVLDVYRGTPEAGSTKTVRIDGSALQSGMYMLRVLGETFVDTQMITLVK